jgi:glycosyltransferase involved in cell wall biosynthesis
MKNTFDKVSIVIPTFNRANYLEKCILACLDQTVKCEIIVCDHGSSDNTFQLMDKFHDKVIYIRREIDYGIHFTWLDGILAATSDIIHINYDDDWIAPTFIEKCLRLMDGSVGCCFSNVNMYNQDSDSYKYNIIKIGLETGIHDSKILRNYSYNNVLSPGAGLFRKKILLDSLFVGNLPFSKNIYKGVGPDLLFSLMASEQYKNFAFINEPLAFFRNHETSISMEASKFEVTKIKIKKAYNDTAIFFMILRFMHRYNLVLIFQLKLFIFQYYNENFLNSFIVKKIKFYFFRK